MDIVKLQGLVYELKNLSDKTNTYRKSNDYIYTEIYKAWIDEFNNLLKKYNAITDLKINPIYYNDFDLSSSGKTVKEQALEYFSTTVNSLCKKIEADIDVHHKEIQTKTVPHHQMRSCFKLGVENCPLNPEYIRNRVFIAMPFSDEYADSYNFGIIPALTALGMDHFRADGEILNKDIMCKVCSEIQKCGIVIVNISGLNPNVMLEQGLAYGLGKPVIILKDKNTETISDLGSIEYIEYAHAHDLMNKLVKALN